MAKFNIEVELDWMDEEAYSIDDELRERIVEGVENALLEKATNEAVKAVDNKIAEKILEAEETIQATVAASGITAIEFIFGLILNVWLGLNMWDYSNMPGNILGQICPQFMVLWFFLSAVGIILDDVIRWRFFGEEKPHYHLFKKGSGDK